VVTKFGHHFVKPFERTEPRRGSDIQRQLEDSLRALQTDFIDLYLYHSWRDEEFANQEVRGVLEKARAAGKVRHIGNSLSAKSRTMAQIEEKRGVWVEVVQICL